MCRWMVYKGQEVLLAELVTRPPNSIIHQSRHSPYLPYLQGSVEEIKARNHAINGDGFGVAWYDHVCPDEPCVFTSVQPSWHCTNLQNLANHIRTHCIFAHVRAASPGSLISQSNCHPFRFGRLLFMHNGGIAHFEQIKYSILHTIQHTSASYVRGTTDSETAGALFVHYLGDPTAVHDGHALKAAMLKMMSHLVGLIRWQESKVHHQQQQQQQQQTTSGSSPRGPPHAVGSPRPCGLAATADGHMPSSLNFAVTDGCVVIATRYRDSKEQDPPSLYYSEAQQMIDPQDGSASPLCWKYPSKRLIDSIVISSEPLTKDESAWKLVPRNHLLVVTNSQRTVIEPINLRTLHSSSDSVDIFEPDASASELAAAGKWDESQQVATRIDASSSPSPSSSSSSSSSGHARRHSTAPGGGGGGGGGRRAAAVAAAAKRRVASSVHLAVPAGRQQEPHLPLHKRSASHESGLSSSSSSSTFPAHSKSTTTTRASSSSSSAAAAATDSPTTTTTTTAAAMSKSQKKKMKKKKKMKQQQQAKEVEASHDEEEEEEEDDDDDKEHEEEQKEEKEEATDASKQEEEEEEEGAVLPSITINDNGSSQQKDKKKKKKKKKKRLQFLPKYILPTPATSAATPTQQQQQQQKHPQEEQQQQQQPPEMTLRSLLAFWRGFAAGLGLALLLFLLAFVAVVVAGHYQFPLSPADHLQLHQHHQYGGEGSIQ